MSDADKEAVIARAEARRTGGPAFPCPVGHIECYHPVGMTLRDHFAGEALKGIATWRSIRENDDQEHVADICYSMADAMLKARAK